ncbi:MAG: FKBP-type peptidyl-prolyl cis-trans isomerase [Bacteroidia bacterium]
MFCLRNSLLVLTLALFAGCGPDEKKEQHLNINKEAIKAQFEKANRQVIEKENDDMDAYAANHQMNFVKTRSGVRYFVYKASARGDSISDSSMVTIDFTVSLLDGTECYSSKKDGPKTFRVGYDNIETGVHRGLPYLKKGDKALLLIPSHLGHGLLGDMNKIPPQTPLVCDIQIHDK